MSETYRCAMCGEEFLKGWTDEEAVAEMEEYFGAVPDCDRAVVCDDCYNGVHPKDHPKAVAEARAQLNSVRSK